MCLTARPGAKDCVRCAHVLDHGRDHQYLTNPIPGIGVGFGHQRTADSNAGGSAKKRRVTSKPANMMGHCCLLDS